jgi:O-antigen ligase
MLSSILQNCMPRRAFLALREYYRLSAVFACIAFFKREYAASRFKAVLERFLGMPVRLAHSAYSRLLARFNLIVAELGVKLRPAWEGSAVVRTCRHVRDARALRGSLIKRLLLDEGLKRFLLLLFGLYLPADYLLRKVSALSAVASVWDEAFLVLALIYAASRMALFRKSISPRATPLDAPLLLFIGAGFLLMCVNAPNFSIALSGYRATVEYMLWFFVLIRLIENDEDAMTFLVPLAATGVLVGLHGIYQYIIDVPIPQNWVSVREMGVRTRVFSILESPNIMGSFMVMTTPLCVGFAYGAKKWWAKIGLWGCALIMCLACLFTFSRGAWLGMAVAVLVFSICRDKRLLALAAFCAGAAVFIPEIANRITYLFTSDFAEASLQGGRSGRWAIGMDLLIKNNPWLGFGLGRFGGAVAMQNQVIEGLDYFYMDNYYLKTLVEMGYIGFSAYLLLIASFLYNGMRSLFRSIRTPAYDWSAGVFAALCGVLTHCLYENIFEVPYMNAYFWGLAALLIWAGFIRKKKTEVLNPRVS